MTLIAAAAVVVLFFFGFETSRARYSAESANYDSRGAGRRGGGGRMRHDRYGDEAARHHYRRDNDVIHKPGTGGGGAGAAAAHPARSLKGQALYGIAPVSPSTSSANRGVVRQSIVNFAILKKSCQTHMPPDAHLFPKQSCHLMLLPPFATLTITTLYHRGARLGS